MYFPLQQVEAALRRELSEVATSLIARKEEAEQGLWQAALDLEKRIAAAEDELSHLRRNADDMTLRSMARQTENELYRYCRAVPPGHLPLTPVEVATAGINRLEAEYQLWKKGVYKNIKKKFPNLGLAIAKLCEQGDENAHPWMFTDPDTVKERSVTRQDLQGCIDRRHAHSIFKGDFETVLACLDFLATALGEPLCVLATSDTPSPC